MIGYVVAEKPELKMKEYELYCSYYCGVCKSIGRRYGQAPRLVLSYDSAFLAAILSSVSNEAEQIEKEHCIVHPVRKKNICVNNRAVDYAADIMIILAYQKLNDDIKDDNKSSARVLKLLFHSAYRKLEARYPQLCGLIEEKLTELSQLEKDKCSSLDMASDTFAVILRESIGSYFMNETTDVATRIVLQNIGFHLGKWMYIIDAYDDIEENIKDGNYNPLIYRFNYDPEKETVPAFIERIKEKTEFLLFQYLGEMGKALDLLDLKKNRGLIENIVFMGLNRKTEQVLNHKKEDN